MLITLTLSTLYQRYRKDEEFEKFRCPRRVRWRRKRTEEGRMLFKTTACEEVARYMVRRQLTSYLYPNTASGPSDRSDQGKLRAQWKHHKIPEISICRRRRFQIKQMLQKDAAESENRLIHKNVNCFIAYF